MHFDNNIILTILSASNPSTLMNPLGLSYMVTWLETRGAVYMVIYNHHVSPVSWKRTCKRDGRPNNQNTSRTIRMPTTPDNTLTIQDITTLWWNFKRRTWWPKTEIQVTDIDKQFYKMMPSMKLYESPITFNETMTPYKFQNSMMIVLKVDNWTLSSLSQFKE